MAAGLERHVGRDGRSTGEAAGKELGRPALRGVLPREPLDQGEELAAGSFVVFRLVQHGLRGLHPRLDVPSRLKQGEHFGVGKPGAGVKATTNDLLGVGPHQHAANRGIGKCVAEALGCAPHGLLQKRLVGGTELRRCQ